jgi:hypothetical protein
VDQRIVKIVLENGGEEVEQNAWQFPTVKLAKEAHRRMNGVSRDTYERSDDVVRPRSRGT